jgi:hypothetical protein
MAVMCLGLATSRLLAQDAAWPQKVEIPATASRLEGLPTIRIDSTEGVTTRHVLSTAEAAKDRLTVKVVDGQFYRRDGSTDS